jgi:hypothetical protein
MKVQFLNIVQKPIGFFFPKQCFDAQKFSTYIHIKMHYKLLAGMRLYRADSIYLDLQRHFKETDSSNDTQQQMLMVTS